MSEKHAHTPSSGRSELGVFLLICSSSWEPRAGTSSRPKAAPVDKAYEEPFAYMGDG